MDINLRKFQNSKLIDAAIDLFEQLGVKIINISQSPRKLEDVIKENSLNKQSYSFVKNVYKLGGTESTFQTNNKINITIEQSDKNDHHIVIYALELERENNLLPSRTHIAEISRLFNREFARGAYILLLFKYSDGENEYISLSHTERNQGVRDPERDIPGKVTILRDINIENPHRGHLDILELMRVLEDAKTFKDIYAHWQKAFDVNTLNKKFYKELLHWYFWAVRESKFPNSSILEEQNQPELAKVEKAKHIIRMITRLLFAWFIKEKHLVPEELFDTDKLSERLKVFDANKGDNYYKAILQNLFFATLNCPINPTDGDERRRCFAESEEDNALNYKMRYDDFFKDHNAFLEMMNAKVPFLNGGLFECLDQKDNKDELKKYVDSFTNHTTALCVPNKLFFGSKVKIDFRQEYGVNASREEDVQGIIPLLKKYKFTVAENTPIEEDVALDPELLGKVFENLLAQYNPETKDSARKESGSFYTPREVVNYMVDESLIAYLKNKLEWPVEEEEKLRKLFDNGDANPYSGEPEKARAIIQAISNCKILDPACGSGAFPMGAMLRMVHVLGKLDPENEKWKAVQIQNATEQFQAAMTQEKKPEDREKRLEEIRKTFENNLLHADYIRKLFLIENCIFGVDIQDIAIQISKLRFFISLVIDQKSNNNAQDNFGILPLPNLETKLVAANTLIGVKEPEGQMDMFKNDADLIQYKKELTEVRSKFFRAHSSEEKENLRKEEGDILKNIETKLKPAWEEAKKKEEAEAKKKGRKKKVQVFDYTAELSKVFGWSPLRQNQNPATFFDPMTMFGLETFDVVMGNPPYGIKFDANGLAKFINEYGNHGLQGMFNDTYVAFYIVALNKLVKAGGVLSYITPNTWRTIINADDFRNFITKDDFTIHSIVQHNNKVFDNAVVDVDTMVISKNRSNDNLVKILIGELEKKIEINYISQNAMHQSQFICLTAKQQDIDLINNINNYKKVVDLFNVYNGIKPYSTGRGTPPQTKEIVNTKPYTSQTKVDETFSPLIGGSDYHKYVLLWNNDNWIKYGPCIAEPRQSFIFEAPEKLVFRQTGDSIIGAYINNLELKNIFYIRDNTHIVLPKDNTIHLKYALALLNSKLTNYYYQNMNNEVGETLAQVKLFHIESLPMIKIASKEQQPFIEKVDQITALTQERIAIENEYMAFAKGLKKDGKISLPRGTKVIFDISQEEFKERISKKAEHWEDFLAKKALYDAKVAEIAKVDNAIDLMVYKLYKLSYDEVKVIDPETPITKEEYE